MCMQMYNIAYVHLMTSGVKTARTKFTACKKYVGRSFYATIEFLVNTGIA